MTNTLHSGDVVTLRHAERAEMLVSVVSIRDGEQCVYFDSQRFPIDALLKVGFDLTVTTPFPHKIPTVPGLYRAPEKQNYNNQPYYLQLIETENGDLRWLHMGSRLSQPHEELHHDYLPLELIE